MLIFAHRLSTLNGTVLMIINLILYSTSHCHLCEQAEALLLKLSFEHELKWTTIEISDNANLYELYEIKIPVLKKVGTDDEICWPFNEDDIKLLLSNDEINVSVQPRHLPLPLKLS
jgi:hypothetical protein